jgi:hypothetical protein
MMTLFAVNVARYTQTYFSSDIIQAVAVGISFGAAAAVLLSFFLAASKVVSDFKARRRGLEHLILLNLHTRDWKLIFNPNSPKGSKKITFGDDGTIIEGRNNNENTWRIRDGLLEILNSEGQAFSRFRYDQSKGQFLHTNDEDTLSLRSQRIEPWEAVKAGS